MIRARLGAWWSGLPEGLRLALAYFLTSRLALTAIGVGSRGLAVDITGVAQPSRPTGFQFLDVWFQWDSGWYLQIAQQGYTGLPNASGEIDLAFFPLFPLLLRPLALLANGQPAAVVAGGLLLSAIALIAAAVLLYKLAEDLYSKKVARLSVLFLFLHPVGFYLSAFLSEGLFIFLLVASLYCLQRRKWSWLGLCGGLLVLTRPVGIIAIGVIGLIYLAQHVRVPKDLLDRQSGWVIGPVIGMIALLTLNQVVAGNPFGFIDAESGWERQFLGVQGPVGGVLSLQTLYLFGFGALTLVLVTLRRRSLGFFYWLLAALLVILPGLFGPYGMHRYTTVLVPLYLALGLLFVKREKAILPTVIILTILQGANMVWWAMGARLMQ